RSRAAIRATAAALRPADQRLAQLRRPRPRDRARAERAEAPLEVDGLGDADALAGHAAHVAPIRVARLDGDRAVEQRGVVEVELDPQRLAEFARPRAEVRLALRSAPPAHQLDAVKWLECADEH